jgi:dUTPase
MIPKKNIKKRLKNEKTSSQDVPPVEITQLESEHYAPVEAPDGFWVVANLPANVQGTRAISLSHRNSFDVDCGFAVKVPEGYKLVFDLSPEYKERGLDVYKNIVTGEGRVTVGVRNLGREIVNINNRIRIASARIEPLYKLTFKVTEDVNGRRDF